MHKRWWRDLWGGSRKTYHLYVAGQETPYWIENVRHSERIDREDPYILFGSGMHPSGCAARLGYFHLLVDAKREAEDRASA